MKHYCFGAMLLEVLFVLSDNLTSSPSEVMPRLLEYWTALPIDQMKSDDVEPLILHSRHCSSA